MNEATSIAGVCERDVDLLLLEEFQASTEFGRWFVEHVLGRSANLGSVVNARRSVTESSGESDLEITFTDSQDQRTIFLIENKVGAMLQPRQAERYQSRGIEYLSRRICTQYCCVIVAPSRYFGSSDETKGFDKRVTYEEILQWFYTATYLGARRHYKIALLRSAIEKGTRGYQPQEDAAVTAFWREYWLCSRKHVPELEMKEPGAKPSTSNFVQFNPPEFPRGLYLMHKLTYGYVDLQFGGAAERLNQFRDCVGPLLTNGMEVAQTGKSASVRIRVPTLNMRAEAETQVSKILSGFQAAAILVKWLHSNKNAVAMYIGDAQQGAAPDHYSAGAP